MPASFFETLETRVKAVDSLLCVGLDPHSEELGADPSAESAGAFCKRLIEETKHVAAAFKPNAAFFEQFGGAGMEALREVIAAIPDEVPVVLDAKRGDISSTAEAYAIAAFDALKADCITLNPYMGSDSLDPFVGRREDKGAFVLCKTSNKSADDFQTLELKNGSLVYENVARRCEKMNAKNNIGLVVGATDVVALKRVRSAAPSLWILAPGVGFQGGNLEEAVQAGLRNDGMGLLVPISRGISKAQDPKAKAEEFRKLLNDAQKIVLSSNKKPKLVESAGGLKTYQIDFFNLALKCGVLKFGKFTLKSGRESPYFFNAGLFNDGASLEGLGRFYAEAIEASGIEYNVIFGPAYKGIPLASVIAASLHHLFGKNVPFAYNRKEKKDHGEGGELVGAPVQGKRVLVVDDVITAGTAIRECVSMLSMENAIVAGVVVALDRQERADEKTGLSAIQVVKQEFGFDVKSIVGLNDLLAFLQSSSSQVDTSTVEAYREKYGQKS